MPDRIDPAYGRDRPIQEGTDCTAALELMPDDLGFDDGLESTVEHALRVERHLLRNLRETRVFHDFGVHAVAMRARLVNDPRKHHGFGRLDLDPAWKRQPHFNV